MYLDLEKNLISDELNYCSPSNELYAKALSHSLYMSPYRDVISEIRLLPNTEGSRVYIKLRESGITYDYLIPEIITEDVFSIGVSAWDEEDVLRLVENTPSLSYLSRCIDNVSYLKPKKSTVEGLICEGLDNINVGISSWYFSDFLLLPYLSNNEEPGTSCLYISSPIGPLATIAYSDQVIIKNRKIQGFCNIHFVATSQPCRGRGMANELYVSLVDYCRRSRLILRRGEPGINVCLLGYQRRGEWLSSISPSLIVVGHTDREMIDQIAEEVPQIILMMTPSIMKKTIEICKHYISATSHETTGMARAVATLSCMTDKDICEWE